MPREYATQGIGFQIADTVPGDFLNNLDDLLYSYSDSVLPTHTGTQVYVQATTGDEAQVAIDRKYFINDFDLYSPVVGPAGDYVMYAVASYVPTAHATAVKPFDLVVSTAPPDYEHVRELGTVEWSGSSIEAIWQTPHKLNVSQLDGYVASDDPADGAVVPVASSNAKLARGFLPIFSADAAVGDVIDYWVPPGGIYSVPDGWSVCDGSVLASGAHDFGAFSITLPDLRDRYIVGANPSTTHGANSVATNSSAGAPGIGGGKSTHFSSDSLTHSHTLTSHSHVATHRHSIASHYHNLATHRHPVGHLNWDRSPTGGFKAAVFFDTLSTSDTTASALSFADWLKTVPSDPGNHTSYVDYENPSTNSVSGSLPTSVFGSVDPRPWFKGFVRIMKVRRV